MANGMGSLYIGASGLQSSQNALNTTANNLANVDTKGYVRQQVLFRDRDYTTFDYTTAISKQQAGLGVSIGDVVHTRDYFLDKYYRTENGRQAFYETGAEIAGEIQTMFQELEGETFQETLNDFWVACETFSGGPDEEEKQNLLVQKAELFISRAQAVYDNLQSYQLKTNIKINETMERINKLGHTIQDLNKQILAIESGGIETAMTLRDERDNALDELSGLAKVDFKETVDGTIRVKLENVDFIDEVHVFEMKGTTDPITGFVTPYWPHLSDGVHGKYTEVFNYNTEISSLLNTDIGSLKSLVLARGDKVADYRDIEGVSASEYNRYTEKSMMLVAEAELDQLVHGLATAINEALSPTTVTSFVAADGTRYDNVRVWDEEKGCLGTDGKGPGRELFVRRGCDRYTAVEGNDGKTYYVYNEEDTTDTAKMYCTKGMLLNPDLVDEESWIPHLKQNGETAYDMAKAIVNIWQTQNQQISPNNTSPCNFREYYDRMIDEIAVKGSVYEGAAEGLSGEVASIDNNRQQVFGVSSDEELQNMIKYQSAYNAASRFINVISEMIEHLVTRM